MEFRLEGVSSSMESAVKALQETYHFTLSEEAPVTLHAVQQSDQTSLKVTCENNQASITYQKTHHFFRGFGLLLEQLAEGNNIISIEETPQFQTVGPMFDMSRNAVMNEKAFKSMIHRLAIMGFNAAMLYMEDTYEVKGEPYFGYMRGRYSQQELKQYDDYANQFGIELIPCIQTLAHLEEFLKWDAAFKYKDTRGALLLESEPTYDLLERMISSVSSCFRSKRIHIGMDEAEETGRGRFLNMHGHKDRFTLMANHLKRVLSITSTLGLDAVMWSDMFLKLASETGDNYSKETEIPDYIVENTPNDVQLMYWQYNSNDTSHYESIFNQHKAFHERPAFAGGVWIWNTFGTDYHLSQAANKAALSSCKKAGIQDVFATLWGDDGQETTPFHALAGLQYYAEHAYHENVDEEAWRKRTAFCTGVDTEAFLILSELNRPPGTAKESYEQTNPSKFLLWQDVLLGVFDKHVEGLPVGEYYETLSSKIRKIRNANSELDFIFDVPERVCSVLALKANVGNQLKAAYDHEDQATLLQLRNEVLPEIITRIQKLRDAHRSQWMKINKAFGFEVIDIRYGGAVNRLETAISRIDAYLTGNVERIEELEEERLYYSPSVEQGSTLGWSSYYYRMATPNVFFHVLPIY